MAGLIRPRRERIDLIAGFPCAAVAAGAVGDGVRLSSGQIEADILADTHAGIAQPHPALGVR